MMNKEQAIDLITDILYINDGPRRYNEIEEALKIIAGIQEENQLKPIYEELVPRKEYPVGGFFKIGNDVFKVVTGESNCENCEFHTESDLRHCRDFECVGVNAILYDTLEVSSTQ
jgi:hypothetical protein